MQNSTTQIVGAAQAAPSDNGYLERQGERFALRRSEEDTNRIRDGVALARLDKRYGAGVVEAIAERSNRSKSTLYQRQQVWCFYWRGLDPQVGNSTRRILRERPELTYTYLREAMKLGEYELAIRALGIVGIGDPRFPGLGNIDTADSFAVYIAKLRGKYVRPKPMFDKSGSVFQVLEAIRKVMFRQPDKKVRIQMWDLDEIGCDDG